MRCYLASGTEQACGPDYCSSVQHMVQHDASLSLGKAGVLTQPSAVVLCKKLCQVGVLTEHQGMRASSPQQMQQPTDSQDCLDGSLLRWH